MEEHGNALTRVVRASPSGIVPVICCETKKIGGTEFRNEIREAGIEFFEGESVARGVAAVAEDGVEIHEVCHHEPPIAAPVDSGEGLCPQGRVPRSANLLGEAEVGVDITNFSDPYGIAPIFRCALEKRRGWWRNGIVVAIAGSLEGAGGRAGERTRDDAPDFEAAFIQDGADCLAKAKKTVEAERLLMARDLENAVGGGIKNRKPSEHMLGAEFIEDFCARGVAIAE